MHISEHVPDTAPEGGLADQRLPYSLLNIAVSKESDFSVEPSLPRAAKSACKGRAGSRGQRS